MTPRYSDDPRVEQSLRHSVRDGVAHAVMAGGGEVFFSAYALFLKASAAQVSILAAVPALLGSYTQLVSAWLGNRLARRKTIVLAGVLMQALAWLPIVWLPYLFPGHAVAILIGCVTLYFAAGHFAAPVWNSLMGDLVPERRRGRFFARRTRLTSLTTFLALLGAGFVLHHLERDGNARLGFTLIFAVATLARLYSAWQIAGMHEPAHAPHPIGWPALRGLSERLRSSPFARFTLFYTLMNFAVAIAAPFFAVYMLRDLGFSYLEFTAITATLVLTQFLTYSMWGRLSDAYGNRAILAATGAFLPVFPLLWILLPDFWWILVIQIPGGLCWAGFNLSASNFLYDAVAPGKRTTYTALHNVLNSTGVFAGALFGGYLSGVIPAELSLFGRTFHWTSSLWGAMLASTGLRAVMAATFIPRLREVREVRPLTARGFAYCVIRFNALSEPALDVVAPRRRRSRSSSAG